MSDKLVWNALVARDREGGIGLTEGKLPWKLYNEWQYYLRMLHHEQDEFLKNGKRTLLVGGPKGTDIEFLRTDGFHKAGGFYWAVISKSLKQTPEGADFLSGDYSMDELDKWMNSEEWRPKIGRVIILGGVPSCGNTDSSVRAVNSSSGISLILGREKERPGVSSTVKPAAKMYNLLMTLPFPSRYFMTVIDHDFKADRKIDQLDMSKWKRVPTESIKDLPVLVGPQREVDQISGKEVSYEVHVYVNH
ncbi:Oidioi.mRNA.OKI2018_I69.chr1.g2106.t1.cds [Oikopleura dioica]|uniref:dihydrofolate reductase n=1 Tax=Oikopleura dioica TaxID=34765 RepID=A0ABN7SU89_OIKDI|nr:Oidioi.mRNA.OKI2018_I69.chr1.g2106.t1.cds [Oikopleura dioica]